MSSPARVTLCRNLPAQNTGKVPTQLLFKLFLQAKELLKLEIQSGSTKRALPSSCCRGARRAPCSGVALADHSAVAKSSTCDQSLLELLLGLEERLELPEEEPEDEDADESPSRAGRLGGGDRGAACHAHKTKCKNLPRGQSA
jgi:hypothetical protein